MCGPSLHIQRTLCCFMCQVVSLSIIVPLIQDSKILCILRVQLKHFYLGAQNFPEMDNSV